MWLAGVFCRSRARLTAAAIVAARSTGARDVVVGADEQLARRAVVVVVLGLERGEAVVAEHGALDEPADDRVVDVVGDLPAQRLRRRARRRAPSAVAAATRARSASKRSRSPSPTRIQRLPSAWATASA